MWVQALCREHPLEEGMATRSSILAWRMPWTEEPGGLESMGSQRVRHDLASEHPQPQGSCDPSNLVAKKSKHKTEAML